MCPAFRPSFSWRWVSTHQTTRERVVVLPWPYSSDARQPRVSDWITHRLAEQEVDEVDEVDGVDRLEEEDI